MFGKKKGVSKCKSKYSFSVIIDTVFEQKKGVSLSLLSSSELRIYLSSFHDCLSNMSCVSSISWLDKIGIPSPRHENVFSHVNKAPWTLLSSNE